MELLKELSNKTQFYVDKRNELTQRKKEVKKELEELNSLLTQSLSAEDEKDFINLKNKIQDKKILLIAINEKLNNYNIVEDEVMKDLYKKVRKEVDKILVESNKKALELYEALSDVKDAYINNTDEVLQTYDKLRKNVKLTSEYLYTTPRFDLHNFYLMRIRENISMIKEILNEK